MAANGYVRQSSAGIVTGATILASLFNAEYNQLQTAFSGSLGHDHSGGAGLGPVLDANVALGGNTLNASIVTSSLTTVGTIGTGVWQGTPIADAYIASAAKWNANNANYSGGVAGGTANALTFTIPNYTAVVGGILSYFASSAPTGAATITINGGTAYNIQKITPSGAVNNTAGDWATGSPQVLLWTGSTWINITDTYQGSFVSIGSSGTLSFGNLFESLYATAALTITLPPTSNFPPYFYCNLNAGGGAITLTPNGTDTIQGVNASFVIPHGSTGRLYTSSVGGWYLDGTAGGVLSPGAGGTGVANNNSNTITLGGTIVTNGAISTASTITTAGVLTTAGDFTTTGAHALNFTTTGATSLTLPTSGTLVNTVVTSLGSLTSAASLATVGTITSGIWNGTAITASNIATGTSGAAIPLLNGANTWSGVQSFTSGDLVLLGSTSGTTTLNSGATAGTSVLTLPVATDTLVGKATTDTLTNKTFDTAGTGNVFKINGVQVTTSPVITVKRQVFTASGTYTPSTGMLYCVVEAVDGGGGGGGVKGTTGSANIGAGGFGGAYGASVFTATQIGASKAVTIGTGGTAGSTAGGNGGTGGATSLGTLLVGNTAPGGAGSTGTAATMGVAQPASSGFFVTSTFSYPQRSYENGFANNSGGAVFIGSKGGSSYWGDGGFPGIYSGSSTFSSAGLNGSLYGGGGGGAVSNNTATGSAGGAGSAGAMIITEYCSQ